MLDTRGLAYAYPGGQRLHFPDVRLAQSGALLVQGRSGTGKSTWLALLCGLLLPSAGQLSVAGQALGQLKASERDAWRGRTIGFLPQRLHLSESLTVRENLNLSFFAAGVARDAAAVDAALSILGIGELASRLPRQLSGGQAQRVALARATLLKPRLILADEPTASLDDEAAALACQLLLETAQRCGASLCIATHDARVRRAFAAQPHQVLQLGENLNQINPLLASTLHRLL